MSSIQRRRFNIKGIGDGWAGTLVHSLIILLNLCFQGEERVIVSVYDAMVEIGLLLCAVLCFYKVGRLIMVTNQRVMHIWPLMFLLCWQLLVYPSLEMSSTQHVQKQALLLSVLPSFLSGDCWDLHLI